MADMKRVGEMMRGVFSILLDKPEGTSAKEVISALGRIDI